MTGLQEYDPNIKPFHTIKGHGIFKLALEAVHSQEEEEDLIGQEHELEMYNVEQAPPLRMKNIGTQTCASTLSMAPCPLTSICGSRGHFD